MVNRATPKLAVHQTQSYEIESPRKTHQRKASCTEVGCKAQSGGWVTTIDESTVLGQRQAHHIRKESGRRFTETRTPEGLTAFTFVPGQTCFGEHYVSLDRPEFYIVRDGDWRGNPTGRRRQHDKPEHWVDDLSTNLDTLRKASE